jgi:two-component system response regulator DesR
MIRVLIAEDQAMVLGALAALLKLERDIDVIGQATNGRQAFDEVLTKRPDVVLADIEMPEMSGLDLALALKRAGASARVVIVTTFARPGFLRRALDVGVAGYLLKDAPASELARAIRQVHAGGRAIQPELAAEAWTDDDPLTERERQVLRLSADGLPTANIATALGLSDGTVRNYLSEILGKLGARNRIDAARIARTKGWL